MGWFKSLRAPRDREGFVELCVAALREAGFVGEIDRLEGEFSLRLVSGESESRPDLEEIYESFRSASRRNRGEVIDRFVEAATAMLARPEDRPFESVRGALLPVLRDGFVDEATALKARARGLSAEIPSRPLASGSRLRVGLVVEQAGRTETVEQAPLDAWGEGFDELLEIAVANLRDRTVGGLGPAEDGVFRSPWRDGHDAARLLLDETLTDLDLAGDPVVATPTPDVVLVTGSEHATGISAILAAAREGAADSESPISTLPVVRRESGWEALRLPDEHPAFEALAKARALEHGRLYPVQARLLAAALEAEGSADTVAALRVNSRGDGTYRTLTQWTAGGPALLPEADLLALFHPGVGERGEMVVLPWAAAAEVCGELLRPCESVLPRWRVDAFPDADRMRAMRALAAESPDGAVVSLDPPSRR